MKFKLSRTNQCKKCPWKTSTNPRDIPDNYCEETHRLGSSTIISESGNFLKLSCHHTKGNEEMYCIGWLHNQITKGENSELRSLMINCENIEKIKVRGEQYENIEDTWL